MINFPMLQSAKMVGIPFYAQDRTMYAASNDYRHTGYDLKGPRSTPILAIADGVITKAGKIGHGYGRYIEIDHSVSGIKFKTGYAHLRNIIVRVGDRIKSGQRIASQGGELWDSGRGASSGAHLHFEVVLPGKPKGHESIYIDWRKAYVVNPLEWLSDTFLPSPKFKGAPAIVDGVRLRILPEVSTAANIVGAIPYKQERGFSDIHKANGDIWLKLNTIRNVWACAVYRGKPLINYQAVEWDEDPIPEIPPDIYIKDAELLLSKQIKNDFNDYMDNLILHRS